MGAVPAPNQNLGRHRCSLYSLAANSDEVWQALQMAGDQLALKLVAGNRQIIILVQRSIARVAGNVFNEQKFLRLQLSRAELADLIRSRTDQTAWEAFKYLFVKKEPDLVTYTFTEILRWLGYH